MMHLPLLHRRELRMTLSALLMVSGVVVTLATSQDPGGGFGHESSMAPMNIPVWETTVVMGEEETAVHLFFSVPTNLLEAYEDQITLSVDVEVDRRKITASPITAWEVLVGDATSPVVSST
ncbi:MAG: hypothetical protein VX938_02385, partial [Myxococcota bacterium]|nr:hypothetical protein [Myxococcota bacterium]